jgi:hypothetical protein
MFNVRYFWAGLAASAAILAGCGGGDNGGGFSGPGFGSVSGVVFDQNGNPVRNAQVSYTDSLIGEVDTVTNSSGAFVLRAITAGVDVIQAKLTSGGVSYFGQNVAFLNNGQLTQTINIGLYPSSQLASLQGSVSDSFGNLLSGVGVYAIPTSGKMMSSAYGITDNTGFYNIGGLMAGVSYKIQANAAGYGSAMDTETLTAGHAKTVNYTLPPTTTTTLPTPTGVTAVAYTAPSNPTTQPFMRKALEAVKSIIDPRRRSMHPAIKTKRPKMTPFNSGSQVEIDVMWNPVTNPSLLGYGIYFSSTTAAPKYIDLLYDPLASVYEDQDDSLTFGNTYTYAVTTVSTSAGHGQGESLPSTYASATPLGPLVPGSVAASTMPTFNWQPAVGASTYAVFLFTQYPDVGVSDVWDNNAHRVSGSSFTYNGPALTSGQTYYYILVGFDAAGDQSLSPVEQFTVP